MTRFAPSPTGFPHLGTAMYAILNFLYARQNNGIVIMRSEDTDPVRSKPEYEVAIKEGLAWLGIVPDQFYRQTDRLELYKKYIAKMIADGTAYISTEANEEGKVRDLVRFKNPNKVITFRDMSRGDISVDTTDLKDFIIAREVDSPLYHLTVVVDDFETKVTHIIRGEDGLANTPRQILIQEAIGAPRPVYAHYPFVVLPDRSKMGKRNGAISLQEYKAQGYLPEAIINFIILMAWHPKDDREIFSMDELIKEFNLERIGKSGAILDNKKLDWLNREYLKMIPVDERNTEIAKWLKSYDISDTKKMEKIYPLIFERISKWSDIDTMIGAGELRYLFDTPQYDTSLLYWRGNPTPEETKKHLGHVAGLVEKALDNGFSDPEKTKSLVFDYATEVGRGQVLWPLRVSLSGQEKSPDPFTLMYILGKDEILRRINNAIMRL